MQKANGLILNVSIAKWYKEATHKKLIKELALNSVSYASKDLKSMSTTVTVQWG
jgi:hypothetical protein